MNQRYFLRRIFRIELRALKERKYYSLEARQREVLGYLLRILTEETGIVTNGEDGAETPEPANGRYPFLDRKVWEEAVGVMQANEDEDEDEGKGKDEDEDEREEEWLEAESEEEPQASTRGKEPQASTRGKEPQKSTGGKEPQTSAREGTIVLDNISIDT